MFVKDYKDVLNQLEKCDFVEFHGYAHISTTVPIRVKIHKGTQNWKAYVNNKIIIHDRNSHDMNKGYGCWNHKNFPEVCGDYDVTGLDMKECFFSINDDLIKHTPEESLDRNQVTQELIDTIEAKLESITKKTN